MCVCVCMNIRLCKIPHSQNTNQSWHMTSSYSNSYSVITNIPAGKCKYKSIYIVYMQPPSSPLPPSPSSVNIRRTFRFRFSVKLHNFHFDTKLQPDKKKKRDCFPSLCFVYLVWILDIVLNRFDCSSKMHRY